MPEDFNPNIAHITAADGTVFQVLNDAGNEWDEAATRAAYEAHLHPAAEPAPTAEPARPEEAAPEA